MQGGKQVGSGSAGVKRGVHKCALRGLMSAVQDTQTRDAIQRLGGAAAVQVTSIIIDTHWLTWIKRRSIHHPLVY